MCEYHRGECTPLASPHGLPEAFCRFSFDNHFLRGCEVCEYQHEYSTVLSGFSLCHNGSDLQRTKDNLYTSLQFLLLSWRQSEVLSLPRGQIRNKAREKALHFYCGKCDHINVGPAGV